MVTCQHWMLYCDCVNKLLKMQEPLIRSYYIQFNKECNNIVVYVSPSNFNIQHICCPERFTYQWFEGPLSWCSKYCLMISFLALHIEVNRLTVSDQKCAVDQHTTKKKKSHACQHSDMTSGGAFNSPPSHELQAAAAWMDDLGGHYINRKRAAAWWNIDKMFFVCCTLLGELTAHCTKS